MLNQVSIESGFWQANQKTLRSEFSLVNKIWKRFYDAGSAKWLARGGADFKNQDPKSVKNAALVCKE